MQPVTPSVLLVTGSMEAGGAERALAEMANYWDERGWHVGVATWAGPGSRDFYRLNSGVERIWLNLARPARSAPGKLLAHVRRVLKLRALLTARRPAAVLSFIDVSNVMTLLACVRLPVRVVVSERIDGSRQQTIPWPWRFLRRITYHRADAVVAQTPGAARWVREWCNSVVVVIPNALRQLPDTVNEREHMILAVGRLTRQKGFDILLQAFASVHREFPGWRAVIIGEGPERASLLDLCGKLGLSDRIEWRTPQKDVEGWMGRAGLVVQPSRYEGFPNVVLEAMGMGAPVIAADCASGPAELIRDGVNGFLVPVEDVSTLARRMRELMSDESLRAQLGREAVRVRGRFAQDPIMREWERVIVGPVHAP